MDQRNGSIKDSFGNEWKEYFHELQNGEKETFFQWIMCSATTKQRLCQKHFSWGQLWMFVTEIVSWEKKLLKAEQLIMFTSTNKWFFAYTVLREMESLNKEKTLLLILCCGIELHKYFNIKKVQMRYGCLHSL